MGLSEIDSRLRAFYAGHSVLVTGGASFIGSHLVELLVKYGAAVTVADDLSSGRLENIESVRPKIVFRRGDLRGEEFAHEACKGQSIVFHLAAAHGGRGYIETHPVECLNNMVLDHSVMSAAASAGASKIVFASSACVYPVDLQESETQRRLLKESDANFQEPGKAFADGEYGWAKLMGELQLRAFHKQLGLTGIACRIFTAYGERENETHAVIALIAKAAAKLDPYPIWGSGLQTRNFTYVGDTVAGLALAGACLEGFQVINLGTSHHHTILDLLDEIFRNLRWQPKKIDRQLDKPVGVRSRAADETKCRQLLGWSTQITLAEGVARTVKWYMKTFDSEKARRLEDLLMNR